MADTPLTKKLAIKPGYKLLILNAPDGYINTLNPLPEGTTIHTKAAGESGFDFVQVFVRSKADVDSHTQSAVAALKPGGLLWFAFPKKTSKIKTDITRDVGWDTLTDMAYSPVTVIAIDDTWSALRFRPNNEVKSRQ
ncbi:MAG: hypothetical protein IT324_03600 [Anaerolineae bacterium]|nr:hypothetical protein [Anaerolineae bacterium]